MAVDIPTTNELATQNLNNYKQKINQESPLNDRSFLKVMSQNEAGAATILYKFGQERALQNLAESATGEDLERIGAEYGILKKKAVAAEYIITLPGTDGIIIPATSIFTGVNNGVKYTSLNSETVSSGIATITVRSTIIGTSGNLSIGDLMKIESQVAGAETTAEIITQTIIGANDEDQEIFRERVLERIQSPPQGGATVDYRYWARTVEGVNNAFPYSGLNLPGDITVYVEADLDVSPPDGIPTQGLLDQVENAILYDESGLRSNMPLGVSNLYVRPISRTPFYVTVSGLVAENEAQVKLDIESALVNYFLSLEPFIDGLTIENRRNDTITEPSVSSIVEGVVSAAGGSVLNVFFGLTPGAIFPQYILTGGVLAKLGGIDFA